MCQSEEEVAKAILRYFLRNPKCADTLEGVANWRLLDQTIHSVVQETNNALDWLVAHGYLVTELPGGSERVFRLNQQTREEALRFVKNAAPHDCSE